MPSASSMKCIQKVTQEHDNIMENDIDTLQRCLVRLNVNSLTTTEEGNSADRNTEIEYKTDRNNCGVSTDDILHRFFLIFIVDLKLKLLLLIEMQT